jgi:hypothetical protein
MSGGQVPISLQRRVRLRAGERCEYCRIAQASQEATFHVDHVAPRVADGATSFENLALACVSFRRVTCFHACPGVSRRHGKVGTEVGTRSRQGRGRGRNRSSIRLRPFTTPYGSTRGQADHCTKVIAPVSGARTPRTRRRRRSRSSTPGRASGGSAAPGRAPSRCRPTAGRRLRAQCRVGDVPAALAMCQPSPMCSSACGRGTRGRARQRVASNRRLRRPVAAPIAIARTVFAALDLPAERQHSHAFGPHLRPNSPWVATVCRRSRGRRIWLRRRPDSQYPKRTRVPGTRSKLWRTALSIRVNRATKVSPVWS